MDSEERIEALHEISSDNDNYVKLSDGEIIGENLLKDLEKYFDLKIKLKDNDDIFKNLLSEVKKINIYNIIINIKKKFLGDEINSKIQKIEELLSKNINNTAYANIILNLKKIIEQIVPNEPAAITLLDIIILDLSASIITLLEPTKIIEYKTDIIKIENIFKNKTYSSFDNIVLLDKFSRFKQKYKRLKDDLRQEDDELIKVMIEDIIKKLKITYGIYDTTQRETSKITKEIYKKIGIDIQADEDKKREAEEKHYRETKNKKKDVITTLQEKLTNANKELDNNLIKNFNDYLNNNTNYNKPDENIRYEIIKNIIKIITDLKTHINKTKPGIDKTRFSIDNYFDNKYKDDIDLKLFTKKISETLFTFIKHENINKVSDTQAIAYSIYDTLIEKQKNKFNVPMAVPIQVPMAVHIPVQWPHSHTMTSLNRRNSMSMLPSLNRGWEGGVGGTYTKGGFEDKPNNKIEIEEPPMLLEHYKSIKEIYIKLVISYYKLIAKNGSEENEIKIINNDDDDKNDEIINKIKKDKSLKKEDKDRRIEDREEKEKKEEIDTEKKRKVDERSGLDGEKNVISNWREDESTQTKNIKKNEDRIKVLKDELKNITESLFELYIVCNKIKQLPLMTEYEENIHNILINENVYLFKDKNDKERHLNHYIIIDINKEISTLIKENENSAEEIIKIQKTIADIQLNNRHGNINPVYNNGYGYNGYQHNNNNSSFPNNVNMFGNMNRYIPGYIGGGYGDIKELKQNYIKLFNFLRLKDIGNDDNNNNEDLKDLVYRLKEDSNYNNYDNNGIDNKNYDNNGMDNTIYENIWNQYNIGIRKSSKKNPLKNIEQGEILYNNVNEHNLVPEIALGVNFQDKAIFVFLILIIRTITMVSFELIIEYNLVKTLQYSIIIYSIIYLVLLALSIGLVNYDSYKLRIVFNYLNVHINSSNLILHIILFIIFVSLIMIMIDSDDLIHNVGYLFDYTKIYVHIYENTITNNKEIFYNILTRDEKIKLLYRLEIITMIIFIFSSFIILLL